MITDPILQISPLGFPWDTLDPFLFCVHHADTYPEGNGKLGPKASLAGRTIGQDFTLKDGWRMYHGKKIPGFPCHPHRGFETVTVVKEGLVDHSDSLGSSGRYGTGDVQWLTAGKGIQHCEMFPLIHRDRENPLELFQIWLNLPKAGKFVEPCFKMLWAEDIPVVTVKDKHGRITTIHLISGTLNGATSPKPTPDSWAANPANALVIATLKMESGASYTLPGSKSPVNRTLYFYKGNTLFVDGQSIPSYHSVQVKSEHGLSIQADSGDCSILLLQGKPINEPVVQYGPFVMNTKEEINDAFKAYEETHFGGWPWTDYEHSHGLDRGRFAHHSDGTEEIKS